MWKEALFSATALLYAENGAMWNKNLIFGGAISWNQAITLCSGNAMTHNMAGMLGVLEWVCGDSSISSVSPATDSTSHTHNAGKFTQVSRDTFLGESTAVMLLQQKWVIFECGGGARLERLIGWDACDILFCFPTAEVTCCCGSTDAWHVARGCVMCICVCFHTLTVA